MTHIIIEDLQWRHTAKKYDASRRISPDDLAVIFEALRLSASSINSQPWKFIVIESQQARQRMSDTFIHKFPNNQPHVFDSSQIILFAYNPKFNKKDYEKVVDQMISDGRVKPENKADAMKMYLFAEMNTNDTGDTSAWTKAQTYIALGNVLHTLARLKIDATPMEGIDTELVNEAFKDELDGYQCDVALAIGYHHPEEDYNAQLPKSRLNLDAVLKRI